MAAGATSGGYGLAAWIAGGIAAAGVGLGGMYYAGMIGPSQPDVPAAQVMPNGTDAQDNNAPSDPAGTPIEPAPDDTADVAQADDGDTQSNPQVAALPPEDPAEPETSDNAAAIPALAAPGFDVVRVDPDGNTVIAGTGPAGAKVTIFLDGAEQVSAVVDRSGAFVSLLSIAPSQAPRVLSMTAELDGQTRPADDQIILAPVANVEPQPADTQEDTQEDTQVASVDPALTQEAASDPASDPASEPASDPASDQAAVVGDTGSTVAASEPDDPVIAVATPTPSQTPQSDTAASVDTQPAATQADQAAEVEAEVVAEVVADVAHAEPAAPAQAPTSDTPSDPVEPATSPAAPTPTTTATPAAPPSVTSTDNVDVATTQAKPATPTVPSTPAPGETDPSAAAQSEAPLVVASAEPSSETGSETATLAPSEAQTSVAQPAAQSPDIDVVTEPVPESAAELATQATADPVPKPNEPPVETAVLTAPAVVSVEPPQAPQAPQTPQSPAIAPSVSEPEPQDEIVASVPELAPSPIQPQAPATPSLPSQSGSPALVTVLRAGPDGVEVLQSGSPQPQTPDKIALDVISYSEAGEIQLSGRAQALSVVRIYLDNKPVADLVANNAGRWSGDVEGISPGIYTMRLDELGQTGAVLSRIETPFKREAPEVLRAPQNPSAPVQDDTATGGPVPPPPPIRAVTVQTGDTLWAISRDRYGDGVLYVRVFEANRADIRDPDLIYPGQVFALPE